MEALKQIVTTLTATLIFISAVELIAPKSKIKKYVSFILGLILISVILNPIVQFITNGEKNISEGIEKYANAFSKDVNTTGNDDADEIFYENNLDNSDARKKSFVTNFNNNCEDLLKKQFTNMSFKCEVDCDVDFNNININIKKINVGVKDKNVRKIQRIEIDTSKNNEVSNKEYDKIAEYLSSSLNIQKEKIYVYNLEE